MPQPVYPESFHSSASGPINTLLKTKLREHALTLRDLSTSLRADSTLSTDQVQATLRAKKEQLMQEVYTIMTATLGVPPKPDAPFTWEYYNEDGKYGKWEGTPLEFYRMFTTKYTVRFFFVFLTTRIYLPRSFSLGSASRLSTIQETSTANSTPSTSLGTSGVAAVSFVSSALSSIRANVKTYFPDVNTTSDDLKAAIVRSIKAGQPVFFGCDVGQFSSSAKDIGIMDTAYHQYEVSQGLRSCA